jgi:ribosomal protein S24E
MAEHNIIKKEKNPFLSREEIILEITSEIAPSFEEVKKMISADENLIVVKEVRGNFGKNTFKAEVFVYESEEKKNEIEVIPKKIRKKMEEERKKAEEQKAKEEAEKKAAEEAAKAEEEKAEESNEEAKPEEEKSE